MIVDPFDKSYNPAKILKRGSPLEKDYFMAFAKKLTKILCSESIF